MGLILGWKTVPSSAALYSVLSTRHCADAGTTRCGRCWSTLRSGTVWKEPQHAEQGGSWRAQEGPGCSSKALRGNSEGWRENEWSLLGGMGHRDIGRGSHIFAWACQDPVTRSRQMLPLYSSLMSEGTFGAHPPPQRTVTEGPLVFKCQTVSVLN